MMPEFLSSVLILSILVLRFQLCVSVDFLFNGFRPPDLSLFGTSTLASVLSLTDESNFIMGRAFYPSRIPTKDPNSSIVLPFFTSFILSMTPIKLGVLSGHGLVFLFAPFTGLDGATTAQNLGFLNLTNNGSPDNHMLGVEFDVFKNQEFKDIDDNHVGINVNSLISISSHQAGYWSDRSKRGSSSSFKSLKLNDGRNYQVWISYVDFLINVTIAPAGMKRPVRPLLSMPLNLSGVFLEEMYVGFTAATGALRQNHRILSWSFSNTNPSFSDSLVTQNLPSFQLPAKPDIVSSRAFIYGITVGLLFLASLLVLLYFLIKRWKRESRKDEVDMEDWELEYWPHRMTYQEIEAATKGFCEDNVIGIGGNGKVYKGVLEGGTEVAVKCIFHEKEQGMREFLSEITTIGRLKHRNLVGFRGWCKKDKRSSYLVYDYMENGSLDNILFSGSRKVRLSFPEKIQILKDVATGVFYLHQGWEATVIHRDIKSSNVLLDRDNNGKLGDFGLARIYCRGELAGTTQVVGTVGYLAPELLKSGRPSMETDVFSYGILILEVMCGRRAVVEGQKPLVDHASELVRRWEGDQKATTGRGEEMDVKMAERIMSAGLLCVNPDPRRRPSMKQILDFLEEESEVVVAGKGESSTVTGTVTGTTGLGFSSSIPFLPIFHDTTKSTNDSQTWIVQGR